MKFRKAMLFAATAAATACLATAASAQDEPAAPSVAFNVGVSNDYIFRGVSQTNGDMQVFGGADLSYGSFYAGAWASNVDFNDFTDAEIDVYAGVKPTLGAITLDLGVLYYGYVDAPDNAGYGNWEFKAAASAAAGPATVGVAAFYSPDTFGAADDSLYAEVNASMPITEKLAVGGALGHFAFEGPGDYTTWNLGATYTFLPNLAADLRYFDNDAGEFGKVYNETVVLTLKAMF